MTKKLKGNNHYIPRFLLKNWSHGDGKLWMYRKLVSSPAVPLWAKPAISRAASHHAWHVTVTDGAETDALEDWFDRQVENPAAPVVKKVTQHQQLDWKDWRALTKFALAQDLRTPGRFIAMHEKLRQQANEITQTSVDRFANWLTTGEWDVLGEKPLIESPTVFSRRRLVRLPFALRVQYDEDGAPELVEGRAVAGHHLWLNTCHYNVQAMADVVADQDWVVLLAPKGIQWPLSDTPVVRLRFNNLNSYDLDGLWPQPTTELFMPLSPHHIMFCRVGSKSSFRQYQRLSVTAALLLKTFMVKNSHRLIFSQRRDPAIPALAPRQVNPDRYKAEEEALLRLVENDNMAMRKLMEWESG